MGNLPLTNENIIFYRYDGTINTLREVLISMCLDDQTMVEKILQLPLTSLVKIYVNSIMSQTVPAKTVPQPGIHVFIIKRPDGALTFLVWSDQLVEIGLDQVSKQSAIAFKKISKLTKHVRDNRYSMEQGSEILAETENEAIAILRQNDPDIAKRFKAYLPTADNEIRLELEPPGNYIETKTVKGAIRALEHFCIISSPQLINTLSEIVE